MKKAFSIKLNLNTINFKRNLLNNNNKILINKILFLDNLYLIKKFKYKNINFSFCTDNFISIKDKNNIDKENKFLDNSNVENFKNPSSELDEKIIKNKNRLLINEDTSKEENGRLNPIRDQYIKLNNQNLDALLAATNEINESVINLPLEINNYVKIVNKFIKEAKEKALLEELENDEFLQNKNKILIENEEAFNFPKNLVCLKEAFGEENYNVFIFILQNLKYFEINNLTEFLNSFDYYHISTQDILKLNSLIIDLFVKDNISPIPICLIIVDYLGNKKNRKIANSDFYKKCIEIIKKENNLTTEKIGDLKNFSNFLNSLSNFQIVDKQLNSILIDFYNRNSELLDDDVKSTYI